MVVDNDDTATKLLDHLNREKAGRVTFMPLNRIRVKAVAYPDTKDAIPVVKRLRYDPKLEKAFQQAFGKTLICRDLDVAEDLSKTCNLNCVTLNGSFQLFVLHYLFLIRLFFFLHFLTGDQVSKKGAFTGGFIDTGRSRIETVKKIKAAKNELGTAEADMARIRGEIESPRLPCSLHFLLPLFFFFLFVEWDFHSIARSLL